MKFLDAIEAHGLHLESKVALSDDVGEATYGDLAGGIAATAQMLGQEGIGPGDLVALAVEPSVPAVVLLLGVMAVGAVAAPINTRLAAPEILDYLERIRPKVLLTDPGAETNWDRIRTFDHMHDPGTLRRRLGLTDDAPTRTPAVPDADGAMAIPTGGTTGIPKAALWTRDGLSDIVISNCIHLGLRRFDRELYISPLFHVTVVAGLFPTLYVGGSVHLVDRFDPERTTATFERFRPTRILTTPTAFSRIVDRLTPSEHEITIIYGAARNAPDFRRKVLEKLPRARLITGYGATEYGPVARLFPEDAEAETPGALGRPVAGARIAIVSAEGTTLPAGEIGELLVCAPWQMTGYLGGTENPFSPDGFIHSGDLGWLDSGGCFFLSGRSKEVIKTGGENVYPNEVENVLQRHPAVADVGVYGLEDQRWGERVEAAVVLHEIDSVDADQLKEFCATRLAGFKTPKKFRFVDAIPYSPNMKLDRRRLQAEALSSLDDSID